MSEIHQEYQNPLSIIFKTNKNGEIIEEISSIKNISSFFQYLTNEKVFEEEKIKVIKKFKEIISKNRYILEFFSEYNNESIYIFFFELFLNNTSSKDLKSAILFLLEEIILNIETTKNIYEYLYQKLSSLYRDQNANKESLNNLLMLLNTILGNTENSMKPRNFFCCSGKGEFVVDLSKENIKIGKYLTFIISFKISETIETKLKQESKQTIDISNLIKINFSNDSSYTVELQNQQNVILKELKDSFITAYLPNEWINLVLCIYKKDNKLDFYFFSNGENNFKRHQISTKLKDNDTINSVELFENFQGEVSSISMALTKEGNIWCLSNNFLKWFTNYKTGFWKKKYTDLFFKMLKELQPSIPSFVKNKSGYFKKQDINETIVENGSKINYANYFIFVYTPFNTLKEKYGEVENSVGNIKLNYYGNIRNHKYQCYQKKLKIIDGINNLMPIAELFLIRPKTLNENNLEIFLKIIINILNGRKLNIETVKENNFFQVLSLFIERYPNHLFTEKILENFVNLGKTIFSSSDEALLSSYFEHIFLNEKILSKYSENLQIKFWQQVLLFCQTDKEQISTFMNMNRICLILRFYDKNKYSEMCCEAHLSEIKDKFIGNKNVMNPTMETKLSALKEIFQIIISAQNNANGIISLYKLLTLDLSPCLTKFILNIFSNSISRKNCSDELKKSLKKQLIDNEFEIIAINTFIHSLPDVRFDLLKLMYEINTKLKIKFTKFQNMIKTCLLPQEMFYATYKESKEYLDEIEKTQIEEKKKQLAKEKTKKKHLRISTFVSSKFIKNNINKQNFEQKISKEDFDMNKFDDIIIKEDEEKEIIINKNDDKKNDEEDFDLINNLKIDENNNEFNLIHDDNDDDNNNNIKLINESNNDNLKSISKSLAIIQSEDKIEDKDNLYEDSENQENTNSNTNENSIKNNEDQPEYIIEEKNKNEIIEENNEKEIIIKDELFEEYKKKLFDKFLLWSLGLDINTEFNMDNLSSVEIKYIDILEIVFVLNEDIKDINITMKFIELLKIMISLESNCFNMLINKKIYAYILELTFKYLNSNNVMEQKICQISNGILIAIFMNSFNYIEKKKLNKYPCYEIRTIFLWGQDIIKNNRYNNNNVLEFINSVLNTLLLQLEKFDTKENFKISNNINSNFYLKNYLIFNTQIFGFSFHFKEFYKNFKDIDLKEEILKNYISSMQLDLTKNRISDIWPIYHFFNQLYKRYNYIWKKENIFKKVKSSIKKGNKIIKYETILQKLILDKSNKNIYMQELIFLTYEYKVKQNYLAISLIKLITLSLMCIISILAKNSNNKIELLFWLKEFKNYILFLIISSSNLTRLNQLELYNMIQDKVIGPIIISICFLKDIMSTAKICQDKIKSTLNSIFLFCFIITKYEHQYIIKHTTGIKFFNLSTKPARNDLKMSAVYLIFNEILKDKNGNTILPLSTLEMLEANKYKDIVNLLDTVEWNEALYNNNYLKTKLLKDFFTFENFYFMENISDTLIIAPNADKNLSKEILYLLPLYEKELSKYSNNSLENTIQKKNRYKAIKKRSFSWNGLWSDKKLFFETPEKLKLKIINHYTKTLMKPLLSPILDIDYYLPEFTDFKKENLFKKNDKEEQNEFKLIMDLDKILKSSELNQIAMNNIKEIFGGNKKKLRENYLRKIYLKSNPNLAESLQKISNNLDLGKEDTFIKLEHLEGELKSKSFDIKKPKYVLVCLVKASHHIKGVCFIDDNNLNFKVFLNQKTGNSMSGVELAFTNEDDDYDVNRQTCFGSYFIFHPKDKDLYQISINYKDMKWIFRRRYYYKNSGIEIFTRTNKSFYFNFKYEKDREYIIKEIVKKIQDLTIIYDDLKDPKDSFDNVIGFENTSLFKNKKKKKKIKISKIIDSWKNWEISNFEFLMWLNIFSNRSYSDISQYPVFPWILGNYEDPLKTKQSLANKNKKLKKNNLENIININEGNGSESDEDEFDWDLLNGGIDYTYRDLSLPMGMLELNKESIKRKELFMEMYETLKNDPDNESKPFLYGSNYSNPIYVCNYMMRLFPFSHISIELQGNKFDDPGRIFFSVKNSFFNSTSQKTDVRELIPEFFYLPELFLNINKLNFGKTEEGIEVDNILTPCDNNPFNFVMTMKNVLESEKVSKSLQKWVDLIFGYKVRGKEAELSNNIFSEKSYQENINLINEENKEIILRQVEFGLIPTQILNKKCTKRAKKMSILKEKEIVDESAFLSYNICRKIPENLIPKNSKDKKDKKDKEILKEKGKKERINKKNNEERTILCIGCFSSEKLSLVFNDNTFQERKISCPVFDKVFTDELLIKVKLQDPHNKMSCFYSNNATNKKAMTFWKNGKIIILGGFFDGSVGLFFTDGKENTIIVPFKDESPVLCVISDNDDEYIFMGNAIGNVCIYKNIDGKFNNIMLLTEQKTPISHIFYSPELNLLATASIDGYICIYTLPLCKLIRCLKVPTNYCNYVMLSDSPLPIIIAICEGNGENNEIYVYSINGNLYLKKEECFRISNPLLFKSINSIDYLACIGDENIYILSLPDLIMQITVEKEFNAYSMCFSEDKKSLYVVNKTGTEIMVIKPEKEKNLLSRSITVFMK